MVWVERRGSALMQDRPGPNRLGPLGLFQALADALKFMFKEDVTPAAADRPLYLLAPVLGLLPALTTFAVIPFGPDAHGPRADDLPLVVADADTGVLLFLALVEPRRLLAGDGRLRLEQQVLAARLDPRLGAADQLRAGADALGARGAAPGRLASGSPTSSPTSRRTSGTCMPQILGFLVFLVAAFAETNRLPFDLPEAESELVAGFHTEYSAMRFATLLHGRVHLHDVALGARRRRSTSAAGRSPASTCQRLARRRRRARHPVRQGRRCLAVFVWVRWTFPRFRYDQLMRLGWKVLLPLAIAEPDRGRGADARGLVL